MTLPQDHTRDLHKIRFYQMELMRLLPNQRDAFLQIIEALASAERPSSVVELSLELAFQRQYSSIHKALAASARTRNSKSLSVDEEWTRMLVAKLPKASTRLYDLFAIDVCSTAHEHSATLEDRSYIRQNSTCGGYTSVGIQASVIAALPERSPEEANWTLPINVMRVSSDKTGTQTAHEQLELLSRCPNPDKRLSVFVTDSAYTNLNPPSDDQVVVARARSDRVGKKPYAPEDLKIKGRGRPKKYEDATIRFAQDYVLGEPGGPDEQEEREGLYKGRQVTYLISRWFGMYVHGQPNLVDVVKVELFSNAAPYTSLFKTPLLLLVTGKRREELSSWEIFSCYQQRFDIEHLFRFSKRNLLFDSNQTPEIERQEVWWWIGIFAYWLLYLTRRIASDSSRRWLPKRDLGRTASPGEVKRVFGSKIFPVIGSPSKPPVARGKSPGRQKGQKQPKRRRHKPVRKHPPRQKAA